MSFEKEFADAYRCKATIEDARYKTTETMKMLVVVLVLYFTHGTQKVYETMLIEHENVTAMIIGRKRALALAKACGFDARPDDARALVGKELEVVFSVDDNGEVKVKKFEALADDEHGNDEKVPF